MKKFICLVVLLLWSCSGFAADYLTPLDLGSSAKSIGLGKLEGFAYDSSLVFENAAGLHKLKGYSLSLFSTQLMGEVKYTYLSLSRDNWAFGYMSARVDDIAKTIDKGDEGFAENGSTEYFNDVFSLAYQFYWDKLPTAVTLKYYNSVLFSDKPWR